MSAVTHLEDGDKNKFGKASKRPGILRDERDRRQYSKLKAMFKSKMALKREN